MCLRQRLDLLLRCFGKRRRAARHHVHVNAHLLARRGEIAFLRVIHMRKDVNALRIGVEYLIGDAHLVAFQQLVEIADMHLRREAGALALFRVIPADAEFVEQRVERLVEQHMVIRHVQVAVVIDPFMFDGAQRAFEGRGEGGIGHVVPSRSFFFVLPTLPVSKTRCHPGPPLNSRWPGSMGGPAIMGAWARHMDPGFRRDDTECGERWVQ